MKTASVATVKSQFTAVLKASEAEPVVVTRKGKPVAVILAVDDEEEVELLLMAYSPRLQAIVEASRKQIREGDVLNHEDFWAEVEASRAAEERSPKQETGVAKRTGKRRKRAGKGHPAGNGPQPTPPAGEQGL